VVSVDDIGGGGEALRTLRLLKGNRLPAALDMKRRSREAGNPGPGGRVAQQLWGTHSVADHCVARAFVADVILYDRVVIPVPPSDDPDEEARWYANWKPERQRALLAVLGDFAHTIEWSSELRDEWSTLRSSPPHEHVDEDEEEGDVGGYLTLDPFAATRAVVAGRVRERLPRNQDARVLTVYGTPDAFDRTWRVTATFPFLTRKTVVARAEDDFDVEDLDAGKQEQLRSRDDLASVLVSDFAIPTDDRLRREPDTNKDVELLKRALELTKDQDVGEKRRQFHEWVAQYDAMQLPESRKVREFGELLGAYNDAVKKKAKLTWINRAVILLRGGSSGANFVVPGAGAVGAGAAAIGTAAARPLMPGEWTPPNRGAAALISEAEKRLKK
jgi:hypothetical protein